MKRKIEMLKLKINQHLLSRNLKLKQKIKQLEMDKTNLIQEKKELIDLIDLQQTNYRELDIRLRNLKEKLNKSKLFDELLEVLDL
jgi:hypothetical protein